MRMEKEKKIYKQKTTSSSSRTCNACLLCNFNSGDDDAEKLESPLFWFPSDKSCSQHPSWYRILEKDSLACFSISFILLLHQIRRTGEGERYAGEKYQRNITSTTLLSILRLSFLQETLRNTANTEGLEIERSDRDIRRKRQGKRDRRKVL